MPHAVSLPPTPLPCPPAPASSCLSSPLCRSLFPPSAARLAFLGKLQSSRQTPPPSPGSGAPKIFSAPESSLISRPHSVHTYTRPPAPASCPAIALPLTRCAVGPVALGTSPRRRCRCRKHTLLLVSPASHTDAACSCSRSTLPPSWPTTTTPPGQRLPPAASPRGSSPSRPRAQVPHTTTSTPSTRH